MSSGNVHSGKVTGSLSKDTRSGPTWVLLRPQWGHQFRQRTSRSGYGTRSSPKSKEGSSPRPTSTSTWRGGWPSSEFARQAQPRTRLSRDRHDAIERPLSGRLRPEGKLVQGLIGEGKQAAR